MINQVNLIKHYLCFGHIPLLIIYVKVFQVQFLKLQSILISKFKAPE